MYILSLQSGFVEQQKVQKVLVMQIFHESSKSSYVPYMYMYKYQYRTHLASLFLVFRN